MEKDRLVVLHPPRTIRAAVARLASAIDADARETPLTVIGVLNGSFVFLADLIRFLRTPVSLDFVRIASYGRSRRPGRMRLTKDVEIPIRGRNLLIVDDIVDTGRTADFLVRHLRRRRPASCRLCALLDKPSRRLAEITPDYTGFVIPDVFAVGYGLDWNEHYRQLPGLYALRQGTAGTAENAHE